MLFHILLVIQVLITIAMVGMILLQRSDADGLAGLSGGGGNAFMTGRGAANFLSRATAILACAFMLNSLILAKLSVGARSGDSIADQIANDKAPTEVTAPATAGEAPAAAEEAAPAATTEEAPATPAADSTAPIQEAAPQEESKPSVPTPE